MWVYCQVIKGHDTKKNKKCSRLQHGVREAPADELRGHAEAEVDPEDLRANKAGPIRLKNLIKN